MKYRRIVSPSLALRRLIEGNDCYLDALENPANISIWRRRRTALNGSHPYTAILTCSDSRVPPEHIFSAGIGNLFVVRTAGNVVGDFELGSIEYAIEHLHAPLLVIMGHTRCGAVAAALEDQANGYIEAIVDEIKLGLNGATTESQAVYNNILHSKKRVLQSQVVRAAIKSGRLKLVCAEYNTINGYVRFYRNR